MSGSRQQAPDPRSLPTRWTAGPVTLYTGDALQVLTALPAASVDCVVTSPPYWSMRDYGTGRWQGGRSDCGHDAAPSLTAARRMAHQRICPSCNAVWIDQQHGLETSLPEYVDRLVGVFREARLVLHPVGTMWLNLGDRYAPGETGRSDAAARYPSLEAWQRVHGTRRFASRSGLPRKSRHGPRPFSGAGITGLAAIQLNRRYVGIDLNPDYTAIAQQRILREMQQLGRAGAL